MIKTGKYQVSNEFTVDLCYALGIISGHSAPHLLLSISWFCCRSCTLISLPAVCHCDCWIQSVSWNTECQKQRLASHCPLCMMK